MEEFFHIMATPTPARPLMGLTVLAVEDSRFASDALRLICLKSGARIRRADCVASAKRHLRVYRPSVAVVDLGLPDGSGLDLIRDLNQASPRVEVILAISGDTHLCHAARAAGADRFLEKPLTSLAAFQDAVLGVLPKGYALRGPRAVSSSDVSPDPIAFVDDLAHASDVLGDARDQKTIAYVAQFLSGVARCAEDKGLIRATDELVSALHNGQPDRATVSRVAGLVQDRLSNRQAV